MSADKLHTLPEIARHLEQLATNTDARPYVAGNADDDEAKFSAEPKALAPAKSYWQDSARRRLAQRMQSIPGIQTGSAWHLLEMALAESDAVNAWFAEWELTLPKDARAAFIKGGR